MLVVVLGRRALMVAQTSHFAVALVIELKTTLNRHVGYRLRVNAMLVSFIELRLEAVGGVVGTENLRA